MKVLGSVARTAFYFKKIQGLCPDWKLQYKFKCRSTEYELTNLLQDSPVQRNKPIAIVAKEQLSGIGQNSRSWFSPKGGIWLSAAYPIFSSEFSSETLSLSFAIKLCEMFQMESINVDLKWPNDIFYDSKKLIGFLPRVITRGKEIIYMRIGLGMNFSNKTPLEGIALSEILKTKNICEHYWTAKILKTIHDSVEFNGKKEYIIENANKYLTKKQLPRGYNSKYWKIKDVDNNGNLRIYNQTQEKVLKRF
ncbi:putative Biotin--acetyl-CoA-carboxylase ligase [Prochlorococcus marinus str. MIT 9515]|uniref:Putative Biotin--acetyl-CoA-carboxylase ligase n=1 Tax=Prochlorococcus marinus (strain MIT 9515) TaxID=167542 RepID=A2BV93_PROM5|nr:biotin--[acetyl-CoA-carboxylase] ligase [Prochlorococcus marinus]ABM71704.1 putative Biotin--acetyl-CoA-carboxylase ligase [Prochlorococcus marinus str. MIT 9515]